MGLEDATIEWIRNYILHRSYYVAIGSSKSTIRNSPHGVPQGSVLGPLLYIIYVNEMPTVVEDDDCTEEVHRDTSRLFTKSCNSCGSLPMYADDGQYVHSSKSRLVNQVKLETSFQKIKDFLNANGLMINEWKTSITEFMTRQKRTSIGGVPPDLTVRGIVKNKNGEVKLEENLITDTRYCQLLGVNLQNALSWEAHLSSGKKSVLPAVRRTLGMLSRISGGISMKGKLQLVNCLSNEQDGLWDKLMGKHYSEFDQTSSGGAEPSWKICNWEEEDGQTRGYHE